MSVGLFLQGSEKKLTPSSESRERLCVRKNELCVRKNCPYIPYRKKETLQITTLLCKFNSQV